MKPRILFLSNCLPYPPHSGVTSRTYNILKQLAKEYDIYLVAFSRRNHQPTASARAAGIEGLRKIPITVAAAIPIAAERSIVRRLWDHLRSVTTGRAYTFYEFESAGFRREVEQALVRHRPHLIHVDSIDLYRWVRELPRLDGVPVACTYHNIESDLLRLRARRTGAPVIRQYLLHQAALVERVERWLASGAAVDLNVLTSDVDAQRLERLAPGAQTAVIPNGTDTDYFAPPVSDQSVPGRVVFVGPIYMFANRDGADHFLDAVWPRVRTEVSDASFQIIGRCSEEARQRYNAMAGVEALGQVADLRPHLAQARCCVVPLRVGGGTRLKILDAWAMGRAVVSTSLGCEGLDAVDGRNILIRDDPAGFAEAVARVLGNAELRTSLEREGRRTAVDRYSWDVIGRTLRAEYARVIEEQAGNAASAA